MRLRPISVLLLSVLFVTASPANKLNAQTATSGGLTGVVTDPSHAVVPVRVSRSRTTPRGRLQSTKTDREGVYRFFFLAPETYTLTVAHEGFRKESRMVNVLLGPPVTVNVTLELAAERTTSECYGRSAADPIGTWRRIHHHESTANSGNSKSRGRHHLCCANRARRDHEYRPGRSGSISRSWECRALQIFSFWMG